MLTQKGLNEYDQFALFLEKIRKEKKIPFRIFDENGVSSRTFQRFIRGESDMRITDLAIIVEILSLSPFEITEKLVSLSKTVAYKTDCLNAIKNNDRKNTNKLILEFKKYCSNTSRTLGKQEALYKVLSADYFFNPYTLTSKEEIMELEKKIHNRLLDASIYTIYNLDFLAYQQINAFQEFPPKLFFKVLKEISEKNILNTHSLDIIERALVKMFITSLKSREKKNIQHISEVFSTYIISEHNWYLFMWKKITSFVNQSIKYQEVNKDSWLNFKNSILSALTIFIPTSQTDYIQTQLDEIETYYLMYTSKEQS
ncbi:Rgg family transcriptional regulator ElrR [Vagococcus elongatus]|uniref:hypothetical protein n=1 Tax=Vagococcus elongatus TaxID=180344 RepID=UPI000F884EA4|nr:hypothetical protein [Vagococcus elongatus]